jgi:hypothetical protein
MRRAPEPSASDRAECEAGTVHGEDYCFQFSGKIRDGKLHFRLHMEVIALGCSRVYGAPQSAAYHRTCV